MTTAPAKPIKDQDPSVAIDACLDARRSIQDVQESTVAGTKLWNDCSETLGCIDRMIASLRRPAK